MLESTARVSACFLAAHTTAYFVVRPLSRSVMLSCQAQREGPPRKFFG